MGGATRRGSSVWLLRPTRSCGREPGGGRGRGGGAPPRGVSRSRPPRCTGVPARRRPPAGAQPGSPPAPQTVCSCTDSQEVKSDTQTLRVQSTAGSPPSGRVRRGGEWSGAGGRSAGPAGATAAGRRPPTPRPAPPRPAPGPRGRRVCAGRQRQAAPPRHPRAWAALGARGGPGGGPARPGRLWDLLGPRRRPGTPPPGPHCAARGRGGGGRGGWDSTLSQGCPSGSTVAGRGRAGGWGVLDLVWARRLTGRRVFPRLFALCRRRARRR